MPRSSTSWVFTRWLDSPPVFDADAMRYLVYQREAAPDTGRLHWQGLVVWKKCVDFNYMRSRFESGDHWIAEMKGGLKAASEYCMKDETRVPGTESGPFEFGVKPAYSKKLSVNRAAVVDRIIDGATPRELAMEDPHTTYTDYRNIAALWQLRQRPRRLTAPPTVLLLIGPTGSGKTRWAYEEYEGLYKQGPKDWWQDYAGESVIFLDEFGKREDGLGPADLLELCDRYSYRGNVKGGSVELQATTVLIASSLPYDDWYRGTRYESVWASSKPDFARRVTRTMEFPLEGESRRAIKRHKPIALSRGQRALTAQLSIGDAVIPEPDEWGHRQAVAIPPIAAEYAGTTESTHYARSLWQNAEYVDADADVN